jgi:hypothetical protein
LGRARRTENVKVIGRWYNLDPVSDVPFELIKVHVSDSPVAGVATDSRREQSSSRESFEEGMEHHAQRVPRDLDDKSAPAEHAPDDS